MPHSPFHHYHLTASPDDPKSSSPPGYTVSTTTVSACCSPPTVGVTSPPPFAAQASGGSGGGQSVLVSSYPAVLVGRSAEVKSKVPPPVPPRGTPKQKRGGGKGGPPAVYDLVATNGHLLHDLLCLSNTNPCCIDSDITKHGFTAMATTTAAVATTTATFHSPLSIKSSATTTTLPTARLDAEVVNNLSDTNIERIASEQAKPLARYSNYEDLQVATGVTTASVVLVDRSISIKEDRQAALQLATMKTKRSHSEADKYVQHQPQPMEGRFMTSLNRFKRRRNLHTLSLKQTSHRDDSTHSAPDVHSTSSNDNVKVHSSQQQVYGSKVKQLRSLFDQRNSNLAVPLKCNVNFRGTRPYLDRQQCQVPQIIVTGTSPVYEQPSQIDRELSLRYLYGHEVYNSKRPQQQQQSSCSGYVGDLV